MGDAAVDIKRLIKRASEVIVWAERSAAASPDSLPPRDRHRSTAGPHHGQLMIAVAGGQTPRQVLKRLQGAAVGRQATRGLSSALAMMRAVSRTETFVTHRVAVVQNHDVMGRPSTQHSQNLSATGPTTKQGNQQRGNRRVATTATATVGAESTSSACGNWPAESPWRPIVDADAAAC